MTRISDLNRVQDLADGDVFPIGTEDGSTRGVTAKDAAKYFTSEIGPIVDEAKQAALDAQQSAESAEESAAEAAAAAGVVGPQVREALRRSYAEAGFTLVPGSFELGGTVTTATDVLLYEADGHAYNWDGVFPGGGKVVPQNSTPATTGGVGPDLWLDQAGATLRGQLAADSGDSLLGIGHGRSQADKNQDVISVLDNGAVGDSSGTDGTDSTSAFLLAVTKAKSLGKPLLIDSPQLGMRYRLTSTVDMRGVAVLGGQSLIWLDHEDIGVVLGGDSTSGTNPDQNIGTVQRVSGTKSVPSIRCIGSKGQKVTCKFTNYFEVYADSAVATDSSSGYSKFYLDWPSKLGLVGESSGWVNENDFYIGRVADVIITSTGSYSHNHNRFHGGTLENTASINIQSGSANTFYDVRAEAGPLTITFANPQTQRNRVQLSWDGSTAGRWPDGELFGVNEIHVGDGAGNIVQKQQVEFLNIYPVASLNINAPTLNTAIGLHGNRQPSITSLVGKVANAAILETDFLIANVGDWFYFDWDVGSARYRPGVRFFDKDMNSITASASWFSSTNIKLPTGDRIITTTGVPARSGGYLTQSAIDDGVAFVRLQICGSSGQLPLGLAKSMSILVVTPNFSHDRPVASADIGELVLTAMPSSGFAKTGMEFWVSNFSGKVVCTSDSRSVLDVAATPGSSTLDISATSNWVTGDIVGLAMDDGTTEWFTVTTSINGTGVFGVSPNVVGSAAAGAAVLKSRFKLQPITLS